MTDPTPPTTGISGTVKVPGIGPVKKQYVYLAAAGVAAYVGYAWWQRSRSAGTELVLDPSTGSLGGDGSYTNPNPVESVIDTRTGGINTNQEWVAKVIETLGNLGYEAQFVSNILVRYLAGQKVTTDEALIVRTAWTWVGYPPDGPRAINTGGTGDPTPDPDPDPDPDPGDGLLPPPTDLHVPDDSNPDLGGNRGWPDAVELHWSQVAGAAGYRIHDYVHNKDYDFGAVGGAMIRGLIPLGSYHLQIATKNAAGKYGSFSPTVAVHTSRVK